MSTLAINPGFTRTRPARPAAVRRPARVAAARAPRRLPGRCGSPAAAGSSSWCSCSGCCSRRSPSSAPHSAATGEAGTPVPTRTVEVGEGDTLWKIASEVAKPGETRAMVHQIEELNALSGPGVTVGQQIAVPVG